MNRLVERENAWDIVPDLAIEVISPTNTTEADILRLEDYFRAGTRLVWLVLPGPQKVYAYTSPTTVRILQQGDDLDGGDLLPGLRLPLASLFENRA